MTHLSQTAFITGASSGIGAAFARHLAAEGYNLILHGRRRGLLQELCSTLSRNHNVKAEFIVAELSRSEDVRRLEDRIRNTPDLALLINNAGYSSLKNFHEEEIDGQENIIRVHVICSVRLTHAAIPVMLARGGGSVINVSSVAAWMVSPGSVTYCATKLYLNSFTESLHLELRDSGIRLQALCPGYTVSDFHSRLGYDTSGDFFRHFMSPDAVVEKSLRDLKHGRVICIPGARYRLAVMVARYLPRTVFYGVVETFRKVNKQRKGKPL
jgi:short-subunit dehydrogenase